MNLTDENTQSIVEWAYRTARAIRNMDGLMPTQWNLRMVELQAQLRDIDPVRYRIEVESVKRAKK